MVTSPKFNRAARHRMSAGVVNGTDLKSVGSGLAGSNPVSSEIFLQCCVSTALSVFPAALLAISFAPSSQFCFP